MHIQYNAPISVISLDRSDLYVTRMCVLLSTADNSSDTSLSTYEKTENVFTVIVLITEA